MPVLSKPEARLAVPWKIPNKHWSAKQAARPPKLDSEKASNGKGLSLANELCHSSLVPRLSSFRGSTAKRGKPGYEGKQARKQYTHVAS